MHLGRLAHTEQFPSLLPSARHRDAMPAGDFHGHEGRPGNGLTDTGLGSKRTQGPWQHHPEQPKAQAVLQLHSPGNSPGTASASSPSRGVGLPRRGF